VTLVRQALHIRTGQRAAVEMLDAWLADHAVAVVPISDVYAACAHLLQRYEQVAELVLLGADWLAKGELSILRYVRETWPRAAVVVYGTARDLAACELAPLTLVCQGSAELERLVAQTPEAIVRRIHGEPVPLCVAASEAARPASSVETDTAETEAPEEAGDETDLVDYSALAAGGEMEETTAAGADLPRSLLTPEELAALLDRRDEP